MADVSKVVVGSVWAGVTGNLLKVVEVDGDQVRLAMVNDPTDDTWEETWKVSEYLRYVGAPRG